jgi:CBS domain containing-hemolysin-like protein
VGLLLLSSVASYLRLLMRRITPLAALRLFQPKEGQRIKVDREVVGISLSALHGAGMALFAVGLAALFFLKRPQHFGGNVGASVVAVLLAVAVCDQLIPFVLVARHGEAESVLKGWLPLLRLAAFLALPLTFPILISTTISRLLETAVPESHEPRGQEELQELIQAGEEEGLLEKGEGALFQSMVEFGDKVVREVMTPRPEIAALEINSSLDELRRVVREKRQSRYPVYSGQLDHIEGIVAVRDLMELPPEEQAKVTLGSLIRPVNFVPETKPVRELLKELQQSTTQLAIVIDEYGSVSGLVTIEDLVEEIVGEIRDEVEPHAQDIVKESDHSYIVAGHTELAQIADQLHLNVEGRDYSTVAGLVLAYLGHVPSPGEKVETSGVTFEVLEANQRTVLKVRLRLFPMALSASMHPE